MSTVLVYSERAEVRAAIRLAVGRRPATDLESVDYLEATDGAEVLAQLDLGGIDLGILDGEAWPTGGLGLARQMKFEIPACPPVIVVIGRPDDRWLARWALADGVVSHPIDPVEITAEVVRLLRIRAASPPVPAAHHRLRRR